MTIPKFLLGDILAIDTETGVLGDHVVEFGMSLFRNAELVYEWGTYVKPMIPIDPACSEIHHIYDRDVEDYPTFCDIAPIILNYLKSADILMAYNYDYDRGVLGQEFARLGIEWPHKPAIDPFIWYKLWHKYSKGKTLVKAAETYGVKYVGAHKAYVDATVTGRVLLKMAATKSAFPKSLADCLKKQRHLIEEQFIDLNAYFISIGKPPIQPPRYEFYEFS